MRNTRPMTPPETPDEARARFLALAEALSASTDPDEQVRLKEELARLTFGR